MTNHLISNIIEMKLKLAIKYRNENHFMLKKEIIWREILYQALEKKHNNFTQKELAQKFGFSLSTVFNALKIPRASGAIEVSGRFFRVTDKYKFLNIWATHHNLTKDIIYKTHVDLPVQKIEGQLPSTAFPACYSAYRLKFNEAPADYDKVYVYTDNLEEIQKRFPPKKGNANLIVLQADDFLKNYQPFPPLAQIYTDLWNLGEWHAEDFLKGLKSKF